VRAAGRRVLARTGLPAAAVAAWPEARRVEDRDGRLDVASHDVEALLRRWLAADAGLCELEVRPMSLEDAFLTLTTREEIRA